MGEEKENRTNQRRWKRFTLKNGALAMVSKPSLLKMGKPAYVKLGPIKDIGMKGLAVQYLESKNLLRKVTHLSIMVPGDGMVVENIPFTTVRDFEVAELPNTKKIRNLCVTFNQLLPVQKVQLERFIDEYANELQW
ncbi:MAG: hypothetical protein SWH68_13840 [Thermodesulfobacteriota bacterium]|nr:hypothetical protein [Thermodesulfobacteriota bacterium]